MRARTTPSGDPAHDVLGYGRRPLDAIFAPHNVAVIGATEEIGSVGRTLVWNLISNPSTGAVFPVNPGRNSVLGVKVYPHVRDIPEPVELAIVATPAPTVPGIIRECTEIGIPGAVIVSAGFKEAGVEGAELERQVLAEARRGRMRVLGPNCLGVMRPVSGFNATFASAMARPGNVGFVSQSGALGTAILDWSLRENVGFSAFVSIGSMMDVGWGDLIYYLGDDPETKSIVIYMESIGDPRPFLSAAREVSLAKPIVVLKAGHTEAAASAAASHTGTLTGSDEVLDAAFQRCGALRVGSIADLFDMSEALAKQPRPKSNRLAIVTNAGGPAVLATDSLVDGGGELARLSDETLGELDSILPAYWSHGNPVDILGDADPERFARTVEIVSEDSASDGLLVILTPQAMTDPARTSENLKPFGETARKPLLASWMGGAEVAVGESILNGAGISTFEYPDTASRVFNYMWRYSRNLNAIYETPVLPTDYDEGYPSRGRAESIVRKAREAGRKILTEPESKQLLAAYGIPTVETRVAKDVEQAVRAAEELGYPVVVKLLSETITHKTDVGGVYLDLEDAGEVRRAYEEMEISIRQNYEVEDFGGVTVQPMVRLDGYEIIIGSSIDPQFGPVLLFGSGGSLVEVYRDRALALPPLTTTLARRMMEQTRIYEALKGVRGRAPVDVAALEKLMVRFSHLVVEQPTIREIDINPLLASSERLLALDARVVVHDAEMEEELPEPAIRPYPARYVMHWKMEDGTVSTLRPIRPEDEPLMVEFHRTLSDQSVYMRYLHTISLSQRVAHERLVRMCFIDYDREMALVAERADPATGSREIMGIGRLSKLYGTRAAECAILVGDHFQRMGLGTELLRHLIQVGREEKLRLITADILYENYPMQRLCKKLGFSARYVLEEGVVKATLRL